jgi:spermidine/putrescine transport system permease protein
MKRGLSAYAAVAFAFLYLPLIVLVVFSFNRSKFTIWEGFSLDWYRAVLHNGDLVWATRNSVIIAVVSAILSTAIGTMAAYGLWKRKSPVLSGTMYLSLVTPEIVTGISLLAFFQFIFRYLHFQLGLHTVILAHVAFSISYVAIVVSARLRSMDPALEEAALDLGADEFTAFRSVTVPYLAPAIAAAAMLQGLGGGGHGGAAGSLAGLAGSGAGKAVATSAMAKGVAAVAVVATVGAGTAGLTGHLPVATSHKPPRQAAGSGSSPSSAHGAGATPSVTSQRGRAGATRRSEAPGEKHGKGVDRRTGPRAHGGRRAMHLPPQARTPRGRRAKGTPHRSSSRRSVHPRPKSGRAGTLPGSKKVRPKPERTVTTPTEKPANLPAPPPGNTSRP